MSDAISKLRSLSTTIDDAMLARAALQYAEGTILTMTGVATDLVVVGVAEQHEGMNDLLATAVAIMNAARSVLHGVEDGSCDHAVVAYRMIGVALDHMEEVLDTTGLWQRVAGRHGTLRDLEALRADPLATVERSMKRDFPLERYVEMLNGDMALETFLQGR